MFGAAADARSTRGSARARQGGSCAFAVFVVAVGTLGGCDKPTELTFALRAPTNALLDPFSLAVTDYVLKTNDGTTVAAVSSGAAADGSGRLGLGTLDPALAGELRLNVMAGAQLVGLATIDGVAITKGQSSALVADVRKPLVVVGSDVAPELAGTLRPTSLLDPTTSTDLVPKIAVSGESTAGFTADGKVLITTSAAGLSLLDTGTGDTSGPSPLPFTPSLLALAPHDAALALIERIATRAHVLLYPDVPQLVASAASAMPISATIGAGLPRAAHFSPSGQMLYVLVEDPGAEPCTGAMPATNKIVPVSIAGTVGTPIPMPGYVADFAVDAQGRLILADVGHDQLSILTFNGADGTVAIGAPTKLYAATCPTALRLLDQQVFAVTNDTSLNADTFALLIGRLDGSPATHLPIARPTYQTALTSSSTADHLTTANLQFTSKAVAASDMAISPDGNRAVIATQARYKEDGAQTFNFIGLTCTATVDLFEYGLYSIDLVVGTVSYTSRSQNVVIPADPVSGVCLDCQETINDPPPPVTLVLQEPCPSVPGDRAAGLAAAFTSQP